MIKLIVKAIKALDAHYREGFEKVSDTPDGE